MVCYVTCRDPGEDFGLNEQHESIILSYMQFARYQRTQNAKFIDITFQDIKDARLNEATYTKDEVLLLLEELQDLIKGEVEGDLIEICHTNVLLFRQLLSQAERWHLRMSVDLSQIQNRELLDKVKMLEETGGGGGGLEARGSKRRLEPVPESSGTLELLRIEIERLRKENERLDLELLTSQTQMKEFENETIKLKDQLEMKESEIKVLQERPASPKSEDRETDENEEEKKRREVGDTGASSEQLLGEYESVLRDQLASELDSMRQEMLAVQSQLTLANQELERKLHETTAFANMKMMISKKNEQVKELRNQLMKYQQNEETNKDT